MRSQFFKKIPLAAILITGLLLSANFTLCLLQQSRVKSTAGNFLQDQNISKLALTLPNALPFSNPARYIFQHCLLDKTDNETILFFLAAGLILFSSLFFSRNLVLERIINLRYLFFQKKDPPNAYLRIFAADGLLNPKIF